MFVALIILKMILAACASFFFFRDGDDKDKKSIFYAVLCLFGVIFAEIFQIIKEFK